MSFTRDVRTRLLLIVLAAVAVALVVATVGFNLLLAHSGDSGADSLLRERADSERGLIRVARGRVTSVEASSDPVADSRVWIFADGRTLEAPRARAETTAAARAPRRRPTPVRRRSGAPTSGSMRLPIIAGGRRVGTIVTGISLAPYEQTQRSALIASLLFAATVLLDRRRGRGLAPALGAPPGRR